MTLHQPYLDQRRMTSLGKSMHGADAKTHQQTQDSGRLDAHLVHRKQLLSVGNSGLTRDVAECANHTARAFPREALRNSIQDKPYPQLSRFVFATKEVRAEVVLFIIYHDPLFSFGGFSRCLGSAGRSVSASVPVPGPRYAGPQMPAHKYRGRKR